MTTTIVSSEEYNTTSLKGYHKSAILLTNLQPIMIKKQQRPQYK